MNTELVINWLYEKKVYWFYIQYYPYDKTYLFPVNEKYLNKRGLTANNFMSMIQEHFDNYTQENNNLKEALEQTCEALEHWIVNE